MAKLLLTPEAQAKVDEMLAAEYPGPVPPLARNASLVRLVDDHEARAEAGVSRFTTATNLRLASIKRYGLLGAIIKVIYWRVSWHELAYRTERKFYLRRPTYWEE